MDDDEISRALRRSQPVLASDGTYLRVFGWILVVVALGLFIAAAVGHPWMLLIGVLVGGFGIFMLAGSRASDPTEPPASAP